MAFMSEAVLFAIEDKLTYKQDAVDDLESLMWVLLWFFYHYKPHLPNSGWTRIRYAQDLVTQSSANKALVMREHVSEPSSLPSISDLPLEQLSLSPEPPSRNPGSGRSSSRRSKPPPTQNNSHSSSLPPDPLAAWVSSYGGANVAKGFIKLATQLPTPLDNWDKYCVSSLFKKIWQIKHWEHLLPDLPGFRGFTDRPGLDPLVRKELVEGLVKELEEIFNRAADQADTFYKKAQ